MAPSVPGTASERPAVADRNAETAEVSLPAFDDELDLGRRVAGLAMRFGGWMDAHVMRLRLLGRFEEADVRPV